MTNALPRRFITVTPPNPHAAIGEALRKAFRRSCSETAAMFEGLLARLDRY